MNKKQKEEIDKMKKNLKMNSDNMLRSGGKNGSSSY
jgi:hypothetical protein